LERSLEQQGVEYYAGYAGDDVETLMEKAYLSNPAEINRVRELIDMVPSEVNSLLDVGAGCGFFLHSLRESREMALEGVDLTEVYIQWGKSRGLKMSVASAHDLPQADRSVDMVSSTEVLEHLQWGVYEAALEEIQRVAKEWILISVPYDERRCFITCPYCSSKSNPDYHHRSFNVDRVQHLFGEFELREIRFIEKVSILTMLKPYMKAPWPSTLICPACHYRKRDLEAVKREQAFGKIKSVLRSIPLPRRPRWLAALYRRA
jgi:methyltransferase family protein